MGRRTLLHIICSAHHRFGQFSRRPGAILTADVLELWLRVTMETGFLGAVAEE